MDADLYALPEDLVQCLRDVAEAYLAQQPQAVVDIDWSVCAVALWRRDPVGGYLLPVLETHAVTLEDLLGVDRQKALLVQNTAQFVKGYPANNALLTGARGTGKSSLIQALLNRFFADGLRVIQVDKSDLANLLDIIDAISGEPYRFLLYCDDLSFEANDEGYKSLKSALDGALFSAPDNLLIYATSNRRHLLPEYASDNEASALKGGEIHHGEAIEEKISLSDRFGLWVTFYPVSQEDYLAIAEHWVAAIAQRFGVAVSWDDAARQASLRWALNRGNRSGRAANQFARHWVGLRMLDADSQQETGPA